VRAHEANEKTADSSALPPKTLPHKKKFKKGEKKNESTKLTPSNCIGRCVGEKPS